MKKIKWLGIALIAAASLSFFSCKREPDAVPETPASTTNGIISASFTKASYVASTQVKKNKSRSARAAGDEVSTVVVVNDDGTVNYDALGFSDEFKSKLKAEDAWLYDVVDIQQCDKGLDTNKGTYIIFDWSRTNMKYSDGTDAPDLGQVIFINSEGKIFDIFNKDGKVGDGIAWNIKDDNGNEYCYFDNNGNIYILGFGWDYAKMGSWTYAVYRWNPTNGLKKILLPATVDKEFISDFSITSDGAYVFINVKYVDNDKYNDVYMVNMSTDKIETIYRSAEGEKDCVNRLTVGPDNKLYFYSNCEDKAKDGLFILPKTASGYSKDNLKRYKGLSWWNINEFLSKEIKGTAKWDYVPTIADMKDFDYSKLLAFIKTFINYQGDIDFTLEYYKDKTAVQCYWGEGENEQGKMDFSTLYAEDAEGNVLKNEAALKHIFETESTMGVADEGTSLWVQEFYWDCVFSERQLGYKVTSQASFPIDECIKKAGTNESVFESWDVDFVKAPYATIKDGVFISNDAGIWVYEDIFEPIAEGSQEWSHTRARLLNVFDAEGHFKKNPFSGALETTDFWPMKDGQEYGGDNPTRRLPFATNSKGIAGMSKDKKTVYYTSGDTTVNLLANYTENTITEICSFNLDEEAALINATITGGAYITLSIDLKTQAITKLAVNKPLDSMCRRN